MESARLAVRKAFAKVLLLLPVQWQSLASRLAAWVTGTRTGAVVAGIATYLFTRHGVDWAWRRMRNYPPGSIGLVPVLSTLRMISSNSGKMWLDQRHNGDVSLHYAGTKAIAIVNELSLFREVYLKHRLIHRQMPMSRGEYEARRVAGCFVFGLTNEDEIGGWHNRKRLMQTALVALLDAQLLDGCVSVSVSVLFSAM